MHPMLFQTHLDGQVFWKNIRNSGCVKSIKNSSWVENLEAQALVALVAHFIVTLADATY